MSTAIGHIDGHKFTGISIFTFAWVFAALLDSGAKWLAQAGLPVLMIVYFRFNWHLICTTVWLYKSGGLNRKVFQTGRTWLLILRGVMLFLSTLLNFFALQYLPLTLTVTFFFLSPMLVCLLSIPLLGEKVGLSKWIPILTGFVGVLIAVKAFDANFHPAVFISLGSTLSFSFYAILTRKLSATVSTDTQQFFGSFVSTLIMLPVVFFVWETPEVPVHWIILCGIGVFGFLTHQMMTRAYRFAEASTLTPFIYVHLIYMTAASWLFFNQLPDLFNMIGSAVVIVSGIVLWSQEKRPKRIVGP